MTDGAVSADPAVQAQLDRLALTGPGTDILGLQRVSALLDRLGNPHQDLPPTFHIAGTNGKGSTTAFQRAALEAAGMKVHIFTSPHLVRYNERIRIAGRLIDDAALAALLAEAIDANDSIGASFFEITTAAAFLAFSRTAADAAIIEVGLGGRLDATNVLEQPAATGIAALGIDHEAFLLTPEAGAPTDPLIRIGWEKAGIAKPGVPLVIGRYPAPVAAVIRSHAAETGALLMERGVHWDAEVTVRGFVYRDWIGTLDLPEPVLPGSHQADNAALAIAMLRHQSAIAVPDAALASAMRSADWPARLQRLGPGPLTDSLPPGTTVWLDGGHNVSAGEALGRFLGEQPRGRLHIITAILTAKDMAGFLGPFLPLASGLTAMPISGHATHDPDSIAQWAGSVAAIETHIAPDIITALAGASGADSVLICGSLYLAGEVLRLNREFPQ